MQSVEACGYEECGAVNPVCNCERGFIVFHSLKESEVKAQGDCDGKGLKSTFTVSLHNAVMGSGNGDSRGEQNGCV